MKNYVVGITSILVIILMSGCTNMAAIKEFGKLSADSAGYTKLTEEYASSPIRRKQYTLASNSNERDRLDKLGVKRQEQVTGLMLYHKTVSEYMNAVANLAADETISFDEDLSSLADAAEKAKYIDNEKANAIKSIASTMASALTDFHRQRKLVEVIEKANEPLQVVLGDMVTLVNIYEESLEIEKADAKRYFRKLESMARDEDNQTAIAEQIWASGVERDLELKYRVDAAVQYGKIFKKISEAHQKLYDNRENLSSAEVQRQLQQYSKKIYAAYKVVRGES